MALVVAVCLAVLPFGVVSVNVTLAPAAGIPPFVTDATIGTVPGRAKTVPETDTLTAKDGGVTTVAFAVADPVPALDDALRLTA